mmetsp:Transcript_141060/g.316292  ORF Transcript_141060/g.316292 Transcript_141060/m.316292 type:complete len:219 (+) Transcript_141060:24-680(+)
MAAQVAPPPLSARRESGSIRSLRATLKPVQGPQSARRDFVPTAGAAMGSAGLSKALGNRLKHGGMGGGAYETLPVQYDAAAYRRPWNDTRSTASTAASPRTRSWAHREAEVDHAGKGTAGISPSPKRRHETYFGCFSGGKRLVMENPTMLSHVETVVFQKETDNAERISTFLDTPMFAKSAGLSKWMIQPPMGMEPPNIRPSWAPGKVGSSKVRPQGV